MAAVIIVLGVVLAAALLFIEFYTYYGRLVDIRIAERQDAWNRQWHERIMDEER